MTPGANVSDPPPSSAPHIVSSDQDLESDLKTTCEAFFARATAHARPLLEFIAKVRRQVARRRVHKRPDAPIRLAQGTTYVNAGEKNGPLHEQEWAGARELWLS